ncbi:alkyl/aryl-sulfatase [Acidovorax sp. BL-A-41-H1]|uniref:alkyl/aryl-sulfatase n=1 Tax=Acidovorax sp. BL-A-41-H1 TaxID=3421102 RepID=UPI003F7B1B5D
MRTLPTWAAIALPLLLGLAPASHAADARQDATAVTRARQAASLGTLDVNAPESFEDARRGLIAAPSGQVRNAQGQVVWDFDALQFAQGDAPATVHPSLWRQARLNQTPGLYRVREGIWQLRGFDLANLTLIQGRTGWIVVDPLTTQETAAAALAFARQHLGAQPVSGLVFTHSHVDHFGGALGVLTAQDAKARGVPIVAPVGFMEEATSENILLGPAMSRRASFMYGSHLPRDARGVVDNGLGMAVATGRIGILPPTVLIDQPVQSLDIDGVRFVFHNVPGSEAPAEMTFELPDLRAFGAAELVSQTMHNLYTLRGAKVRDALAWSRYIDSAIEHAGRADVVFLQHGWPVWGRERIDTFMTTQRDTYRYLHDQTVRLLNAGLTPGEIAETVQLPSTLAAQWASRGYYGTVRHNVRAVAQFYLGWFDAHPATLDPLPPVEAARRYVALAGGTDKAVAAARQAHDAGDYRWAAELLRHVLLADGKNAAASNLMARSFEQLGYAAESAPWRNFYLTGAQELRHGVAARPSAARGALADMLMQTPVPQFLDAMAASLNGPRADGVRLAVALRLPDVDETHSLWVDNAVLHHRRGMPPQAPAATLVLNKPAFLRLVNGQASAQELVTSGVLRIEGDAEAVAKLMALLDKPARDFSIMTR